MPARAGLINVGGEGQLIIGGLGLNAKATRQAIESLPAEVTLSFVPYADGLQGWIDNNNIDILVMLTHRRTLIGTLFNSSMTKKMSYHTNIPLLAIPDIS